MMDFYTFFPRVMADCSIAEYSMHNHVFPFLFTNGWLYPNNLNKVNIAELRNTMREFLDKLDDEDAVYCKLINEHGFSQEDIFDDLLGLLHAAHQTSHHTVCSALYYIKKHPEWYDKIKSELNQVGVHEECDYKTAITGEIIHDSFNLAIVVKETLRVDPAGNRSQKYKAYEDAQICEVPIPKNSMVQICVLSAQYNTKQWPDPEKFKPERFDPQSKNYFVNSETSTPRHPMSYIPFSFGPRKCPGMILALIEVKTLLAYMVTKLDYSIDESLLKNENARFSIYTNFDLTLKINKIR
jgi:cytochrome P450